MEAMMPGAKCPKCENLTLFKNPTGKWCTTKGCGFTATVPANNGTGGRGKKCVMCKTQTVQKVGKEYKCSLCGTIHSY
jgi:hypothetical protein